MDKSEIRPKYFSILEYNLYNTIILFKHINILDTYKNVIIFKLYYP